MAEDAAPDYGTKLYYKSEGLDFEKAIANINELYETHVINFVNDEINFVRKKYYDANANIWCRDYPPCDGVRHYLSPRLLQSSHGWATYMSRRH